MAVSVTLANNDYVIVYQTSDGVSFDELDATGVVVVGDVKNGQAAYPHVAALGPEWSFHG